MSSSLRHRCLYGLLLIVLFLFPVLTSCGKGEEIPQAPPKFTIAKSLFSVCFIDSESGWAVGKLGTLVHTADGGKYWSAQNSATDCNLRGIFFFDHLTGWAVGDRGTIRFTKDGGKLWDAQKSGTEHHLRSICFLGPDKGFIVGEQGTFLETENAGKNWKKRDDLLESLTVEDVPFAVSLFKIVFIDTQNGWIAGDYGRIFSSKDAGKSWSLQQTDTDALLLDIEFVDPLNGWAVGEMGTILHTADGGETWQAQTSEITYLMNGVEFADKQEGWICTYGHILHTMDGGANWEVQLQRRMWLYDMWCVDRDNVWAPGDFGEIVHLSAGGREITVQVPWQ